MKRIYQSLRSDEGWYKQDQAKEDMVELLPRTTSDSSSDDDDDIVELDLDEALKKAGEFGWYQKFLIFIQCLSHTVGVYHILGIAFIGLSPVWVCSEESINLTNETSTNDTEDTKCSLYEERDSNCTPVYEDRFYSLTQEVHSYTILLYYIYVCLETMSFLCKHKAT